MTFTVMNSFNRARYLLFLSLIFSFTGIKCLGQDKAAGYLASAKDNLKSGDRFSALVTLDSAVTVSPKFAEAYYLRAKVKIEIQNLEGAIEDLTNVVQLDPGNAEAYYQRSNLYLELNYHRDYSIRDLSEAIALDSKNTKYLVRRAYVRATTINSYSGKKEYDMAINDLNRAMRIDPHDGNLYYLRATYELEEEMRQQAMLDYDKAIELNPNESKYYGERGLLNLLLEKYQQSASDFNKAISLDPSNSIYFRHLAQAYYNYGNYPAAINSYSEALNVIIKKLNGEKSPENRSEILKAVRDIYLMRGSAFALLNRDGEACSDFSRARELGERRAANYMRKYCSN